MRSSTRPPDQYMTAQGTIFRLVPNEYDKNSYGQCNYSSYRTLIRCKQIRSKEELARNNGQCEEHNEFSRVLEENHRREVMRTHAENDTKMQRRRFDPWIASNEHISDEDDYLQAVQTLPEESREPACDNSLDNHPLRNAGHYTDKDVLRIKMDLVQKDIDDLLEFKKLMVHQAQKDHEMMGNDEDYEGPNDLPQRRIYKAAKKYTRNDYLTLTKTVDPVFNKCVVGPEMDDAHTITHIIHSMLDNLDNIPPISTEEHCQRPALHFSKFCSEHIILDRRQKMFTRCRICGTPAMDLDEKLCTFHLKLHTIGSADCPCSDCARPNEKSHSLDEELDDELGNLSRIEEMISPLQQFAIPPLSSPRAPRYSRAMGSASSSSRTAAQRVVANLGGFQHAQRIRHEEQMKLQEEELKTHTCARVRPIDATQFGSGKKIPEQQLQKQQVQQYASPPRRPTMPSILPNSSPYAGVRPLPAWRNAGQTVRAMHQMGGATQYPIQRAGAQRAINMERAQEPKTGDELVEDRGSSPTRTPEPQRRGVPYYKNQAAYRRTDRFGGASSSGLPSSFTVPVSTGPLPGGAPGAQRYRPANNRPMAPHRAIAAGLNPGEPAAQPPRAPAVYRLAQNQGSVPPYHQPPVPRRQAVPPHRMMGKTTSYQVVSSAGAPGAATGAPGAPGAPGATGFLEPPPGRSTNPILPDHAKEETRHEARFANINVKTFLTMKPEDLNAMTQEEIDLLSTTPPTSSKSKKSAPSSAEQPETPKNAKKRKIEETIEQVVSSLTSPPAPAPETPVKKEKKEEKKEEKPARKSKEPQAPPPRAPRAAAVAANQAIVQQKPSVSTASSSSSTQSSVSQPQENPLDLLAELSEAAAFEEQKALETPKGVKKGPKKSSPKRRPSSSSNKKRGDSDEEL